MNDNSTYYCKIFTRLLIYVLYHLVLFHENPCVLDEVKGSLFCLPQFMTFVMKTFKRCIHLYLMFQAEPSINARFSHEDRDTLCSFLLMTVANHKPSSSYFPTFLETRS